MIVLVPKQKNNQPILSNNRVITSKRILAKTSINQGQ